MNARDVMSSKHLWSCHQDSSCQDVAQMMCQHDVGAIPVVDNRGHLVGIVTDRDISCRAVAQGKGPQTRVSEIMSEEVESARPDASLSQLESLMRRFKIRRVPIVDEDETLEGFVSLADIATHCSRDEEHELIATLETISEPR